MKVIDIANDMGVSAQAIRVQAQQGQLPFITVTRHRDRCAYIVHEGRYEIWKKGGLNGISKDSSKSD